MSGMTEILIPTGFDMGVATASWQVEGDVAGRGRCNWDEFSAIPGKVVDAATGEPACDHVNRLDEDLDLIDWIGVDSYRFSISWPRVMPGGSGPLSASGVDFYDRLIDGLLARGVNPVATLFHWDTPLELEHAGGWTNRDTAYRFAEYAEQMAQRFGDRVERWATLNEPWCSAFLGYCAGYFAPGRTEPGASLTAVHHLLLGHGLAVQRMRAAGARNLGIVLNLTPIKAESPETEAAARHIDGMQNRIFLDPIAGRGYPADIREATAHLTDWSFVHDGDLDVISTPLDWLGENYYTVMRIAAPRSDATAAVGQDVSMFPASPPVTFTPHQPVTDMGWEINVDGIVEALRMAADAVPGVPLWICENGMALGPQDEPTDDGGIHDVRRIDYLRDHIGAVLSARDSGIDVRGYYAWSLLDNLEWASGWTKKFGIVRVDPPTGTRTRKDSAFWLRDRLAERG